MTIMPGRCLLLTLVLTGVSSVYANPTTEIAQNSGSVGQNVRNFFETGRLSSEDRLMFRRPPSGIIPLRETANSWQFIIFKEGNVSFWVPPGILTQDTVVLDTALGEVSFRSLASHTEDRHYVAAYAEGLTEEQQQDPQVLLQAIRDKVAPEGEFKLINDRSIQLDNYPGQELVFENSKERITMRIYLANQRVYALGVRYPQSTADTRSVRAFLNALELIDR